VNKIKISVVMSVYNAQDYLEEAIESVLNQTYQNIEFVIINDGSTDRSLDIIQEYSKQDQRIVLIDQENMGLTRALNVGVRRSSGDFIARQDADDVSYPNRFEGFINYLKEHVHIDFYSTPAYIINEHIVRSKIIPNYFRRKGFSKKMLSYHNSMIHGALIIKSSLAKKYLYNEDYKYSQDFELYHRLLRDGLVLSYDSSNISYGLRLHAQSISNNNSSEQLHLYQAVFLENKLKVRKLNSVNRILFRLFDVFFYLRKLIFQDEVTEVS